MGVCRVCWGAWAFRSRSSSSWAYAAGQMSTVKLNMSCYHPVMPIPSCSLLVFVRAVVYCRYNVEIVDNATSLSEITSISKPAQNDFLFFVKRSLRSDWTL